MDYEEDSLDDAIELVGNESRREIVSYLQESDEALVEEVAYHLSCELDMGMREAKIEMRHCHLPMLEDYGVVSYDERSGTFGYDLLNYQSDDDVEQLLEVFEELEE